MDIKTLLDEYVLALKAERRAPNTVQWYYQNIRRFATFMDGRLSTTQEIRQYLVSLQGEGYKPSTIDGAYRALRAFFNFLEREEIIDENPMSRIRPPKKPRVIIKPLSEEDVRALLRATRGPRDHAMVAVLVDTGIRASEAISLKLDDVDIHGGRAKVMGKGSRERFVPVGFKARRLLLKYINRYRPDSLHSEVFLTQQGTPMTRNCLTMIFRRLSGRSGVKCSPHKLRHTFAVSYLRNGGDIFTLQRILGHSSLEMVRRYVTLADGDVQRVHERASPMDRL